MHSGLALQIYTQLEHQIPRPTEMRTHLCVCLQGKNRKWRQLFVLLYVHITEKGNAFVLLGLLCWNATDPPSLIKSWKVSYISSLMFESTTSKSNYFFFSVNSEISTLSQTKNLFSDFLIYYLNKGWRTSFPLYSLPCCCSVQADWTDESTSAAEGWLEQQLATHAS